MQSANSGNIPSQTISNSKGGRVGIVTLHSGRELPHQFAPQQNWRPADAETKSGANSQEGENQHPTPGCNKASSQVRYGPQGALHTQEEENERRSRDGRNLVGIDHTGRCHYRSITSLIEEMSRSGYLLGPMHHRQLYFHRCHAGLRSFNQRHASINVSVSKLWGSKAYRDGNPISQQEHCVNELIFATDFYMLDMEDEAFGKGSMLILERPFLMMARMKIDVYVGTLSMEFVEPGQIKSITPSRAGQAELIRVNKGVSAEMKLSRSDRLHLGRTRVVPAVHALQPSNLVERPNCIDHISYPARRPSQRQLSCHVTPRKSAMSR
ncbi:hypothetical protein CR513_52372, partial [Mucuna pruriens]